MQCVNISCFVFFRRSSYFSKNPIITVLSFFEAEELTLYDVPFFHKGSRPYVSNLFGADNQGPSKIHHQKIFGKALLNMLSIAQSRRGPLDGHENLNMSNISCVTILKNFCVSGNYSDNERDSFTKTLDVHFLKNFI